MPQTRKDEGYTRYPLSSRLIYNGATILHYALGGIGILIGYKSSSLGVVFTVLYIIFAFGQMYILMPLLVCPNCVYYRLDHSVCITGLNLVSRRLAREGEIKNFNKRGEGLFCHNNLYLAAKVIPLVAMLPALILNFSIILLLVFLAVAGLLIIRIFVIFPKVACGHCRAVNICPNAKAMGLSKT